MTALPSSLPAASRGSGSSDRPPGSAPVRAADSSVFARTLAQVRSAQPSSLTEVEVRPGDTLAGLVGRHLKATQPQLNPSSAQLLELAVSVARDNAIANPHLIMPGQVIDMTALDSRALALVQGARPTAGMAAAPAHLARSSSAQEVAGPLAFAARPARSSLSPASTFLVTHAQAAQRAEAASGIPAHFMLGQAALETGWGQREIRYPDGRTSHNLFGIRAGSSWQGPTVDVWTNEYVNGVSQRVVGRFRAYASYEESFADYARLIGQQPRYAQVMRNTGDPAAFASALQSAGYATSPRYASALHGAIQTAMHLQSSVPEVRMAMTGATQPQWAAAATEPALLPAAQALNLRWTPIAPMPGSALAQAGAVARPVRLPS